MQLRDMATSLRRYQRCPPQTASPTTAQGLPTPASASASPPGRGYAASVRVVGTSPSSPAGPVVYATPSSPAGTVVSQRQRAQLRSDIASSMGSPQRLVLPEVRRYFPQATPAVPSTSPPNPANAVPAEAAEPRQVADPNSWPAGATVPDEEPSEGPCPLPKGKWADPGACEALCLLIMDDRKSGLQAELGSRPRRRPLPPALYAENVAPFLRFDAPLPNMLYAFGGRSQGRGPLDTAEMFDSWHGRWVECTSMPTRRAGSAAAVLQDGKMIVIGGYNEKGIAEGLLATCDIYDPFTQSWQKDGMPALARARWGHGCAAMGGKVYVVGGCSLQPEAPHREDFMETLKCCEVLNPQEEKPRWRAFAPLQIARSGSRVVALQGDKYLVAIGGCDDVFGRAETQPTVELFDASIGHWALLQSRLTHPRTTAAAAAIGSHRLLVVGGAPSLSSTEVYDVDLRTGTSRARHAATNSETAGELEEAEGSAVGTQDGGVIADMPDGRMGCQAAVMNLPRPGCAFPLADQPCAVIVGGERCDEQEGHLPTVRQFSSIPVFDIEAGTWREDSVVPQLVSSRTAVALCVGLGRVTATALSPRPVDELQQF